MELEVALDQLPAFAAQFWKFAGDAQVIAFHGAMGAGKTTTIAALCRSKGVEDAISSPTFSIINEYAYRENGSEKKLYHIDLYRLNDTEEIIRAGVEDCLLSGVLCMVEWPEKAPHLFDEHTLHVVLTSVGADRRLMKIRQGQQFNNHSMAEQL